MAVHGGGEGEERENGLVGGGSLELREGGGMEGGGRQLNNLDPDMLVKVFSYLPRRDLFEVMLVSKYWEEVVTDGKSGLWKMVELLRKWDNERRKNYREGNEVIREVLGAAEGIAFSCHNHLVDGGSGGTKPSNDVAQRRQQLLVLLSGSPFRLPFPALSSGEGRAQRQ